MVVKYTPSPFIQHLGTIYKPLLPVRFHNGVFGFKSVALVDSGSYITLLNKDYAKRLGLIWNKGKEVDVNGISGRGDKGYVYDIDFDIVGLADSRKIIRVAFVDLNAVDVLLGQIGFFEHYNVTFKHSNKEFYIDLPSLEVLSTTIN